MDLKSLLSLSASKAACSPEIAYLTADRPAIVLLFLSILLLIAFALGARSASTRLCAREVVSIPEPVPNLLITLAFAAVALEADVLVVLDVLDVLVVPDVEVTAETIIGNRLGRPKL